jgi:hypothetical protein
MICRVVGTRSNDIPSRTDDDQAQSALDRRLCSAPYRHTHLWACG